MKKVPLDSLLAVDIGGGTQDIIIYRKDEPIENAVKLVLPSPTVIAGRRIAAATRANRAVFLSGRVMGGGAVSKAVRNHLKAGLAVSSLPDPALTIHDNLEKVTAMGVRIVDGLPEEDAVEIICGDLDLKALGAALALFEVDLPEKMALAIQDHGFSPQASNRLSRFRQWQDFLDRGGDMGDLLFEEPPDHLSRWKAAARIAPGAWFMDTGSAALRGALLDDFAALQSQKQGLLVVNAGNEHTVGFLVLGRVVWGVYEHHTGLLDPATAVDQLERFSKGQLPHDEVFDGWGHGVAYRPGWDQAGSFEARVVTGPRRALLQGFGHMAAPHGEMMLSGCFGLVEALLEKL